jgi:aryl-alcohol dehydrogenase-like predicted oxidoreductase
MTVEGSARFASRRQGAAGRGFYRTAQGMTVSSLGLGTYLGDPGEAGSAAYQEAIREAARGGINVFDTAINYRGQASERDLGAALRALADEGSIARDEILICTKAGFLTPGAVPEGLLERGGAAGRIHSMAPDFIEDQVSRSLANLGVQTIDVFYLHNPETQLRFAAEAEFEARLWAAFERCERLCERGWFVNYGVATWSGLRLREGHAERLSLPRLMELARDAGGEDHHFRFVQLPLSLAMPEAFALPHAKAGGEDVSVLECAARSGVTVVTSAPMLQGRLASGLPPELRAKRPEASSDALLALEFARSTPGVTVTLAGMGRAEHVRENLGLMNCEPMGVEQYLRLFERGA